MPEIVNGIRVPVAGDPVDLPGDLQRMAEDVGTVAEEKGAEAGAQAAVDYASTLDDAKMSTAFDIPDGSFRNKVSASFVVVRTSDGFTLPEGTAVVLTLDKTLAEITADPTADIDDITFEEI